MNGFTKINLSSKPEEAKKNRQKSKATNILKRFGIVVILLLIILLITGISILLPARELYFSVQDTVKIANETYVSLKNQNIDKLKEDLNVLETGVKNIEKKLSAIAYVKYIPFIGNYERDAEHLVKASLEGVAAGKITVDALVPYADLLGLKGKSTFVSGSADDRIQTAVATLDKVTPKFSEISKNLSIIGSELDQIDTNRYPKKIGDFEIKDKILLAKDMFSNSAQLFVDAEPLLSRLPDLLGNKEAKTYLIIFQNDAELRATGGFITAYALFKIDKGKMQVIKADDIYKLDESKKKKFPAPESILKYHKGVNYLELRDSNLSPDFVTSMNNFEKMLTESIPDFPKFDGIITLDTHVLVESIKILGEFNVYGRKFSSETDKRCDCPQAIYELEDYSTKPVAYVREDRKDIIGVLMYQIMQRALGVSPSKYWGNLFQMFLTEAKQKHMIFYFHDESAQKGIEALDFGGRIISFDKDYLHINDVNFAGAKSNLFIKQSVKQDIEISSDGTTAKVLSISYKNPSPASNCNLEAGQLCLNGILRNWIRIYVPKGSVLTDFTGSEMQTATYEELGKTVFEGFFTVKPQGSAEIIIKYNLPIKFSGSEPYQLFIQKQPGSNNPEYTVNINGKDKGKFLLLTDKEFKSNK
ncbi:hypothetical protein A2Y99_03805 [Candidatus Gottesmanbacteria bacterium RBG_13_37_7]|uniref:DUF4012 domain-containing protein n=1 Tax=Candidatus Gottesmanbacteria bacterium RBG_13_37_7 TaxID=1798369 RepID=A0A1F5YGB2_9BACT|nr:MAG: hypothetical protein A2Y99_03805 [Candidatus Gottesmanbacteria bacterium RBG_13_37_7]